MKLKELRLSKHISQAKASIICNIPIRTYKRLENDIKYVDSYKYKYAYYIIDNYSNTSNTFNYSCNIAIVGAGYVGYSLATVLAKDNNITLIDINKNRVNQINKDINKNIKASLPSLDLYKDKDYIFICVPTDYNPDTGLLNTDGVTSVIKDIRRVTSKTTIVIKSTCNIGYTASIQDKHVIYCPEFLKEKTALFDMRNPSRIIIGVDNKNNSTIKLSKLLQRAADNHPTVLFMSTKEAESVKLFSNAYLAMRVAFFNELDSFAIDNNIDTRNIINGVCLDPRIGDYYNNPSIGYSGKCLPKDTLALSHLCNSELISSIDKSNNIRKKRMSEK